MTNIRYPDNRQPLEDASLLQNAVRFATGERWFACDLLLRLPLVALKDEFLAYATSQAYAAEVTTTEDTIGWLLVLRDWKPGTVDGSLLRLLDKVSVDNQTEKDAFDLLEAQTSESFRALLHSPTDDELGGAGLPDVVTYAIQQSTPAVLDGLRNVLRYRQESGRGRVVAFNEIKHVMVGINRPDEGHIKIVSRVRQEQDGVHLSSLDLEVSSANIRLRAGRAISMQATLNHLLGLVGWVRFGDPYEPPDWVRLAAALPVWTDDSPPASR